MYRILNLLLAAALGAMIPLPADDAANSLSVKEKADGWVLLFDRKSLNGWESRQGGAEWKVTGGAIMTDSPRGCGLFTTQEFTDFVLRAEFRTTNDVNGGMYLCYNRTPAPHASGDGKAKKKSGGLRGESSRSAPSARVATGCDPGRPAALVFKQVNGFINYVTVKSIKP